MIKKKLLPLLAVMTAGSIIFLSGCEVDLTTVNEEEVPISVELEAENLRSGTITVHSVWYDSTGATLPYAGVTIYNGNSLVYSGSTDADGRINTCPIPFNTELDVTVTDSGGAVIARTDLVIKVSDDYDALSVYPTDDEGMEIGVATCVIEVPSDKLNIRAAIFVTEGGSISFANLTPYVD